MAEEQQNNGLQFEDIVPYVNDSGDTGLTSRLKLKRNFDKIKLWAQQVAASVGNLTTTIGNLATSIENALSGLDDKYLSKTDDDTAAGTITFADGITFGDGNTGIDENGDAELRDATMRDVTGRNAEFENLRVTKEASFFRLVVNELLSNKGAIIISSANCVAESVNEDQSTYTILFSKTDKNGIEVNNPWVVGDHALCLTFKGEGAGTFTNVKNRYYWRKVVSIYTGDTYHSISLSKTDGEGSTVPAAGDNIVQLGYSGQTPIPARQTAIILSAYQTMDAGVTPPSLAFYKGINDFTLSSHRYTYMDGVANEFFGDFKVLVNNSYTSMTTLLATTNRLIAEIRNDLGTVGVDINSDDMTINLKAGKVNFLMPDGSTNAKISIDPTTGTLHAVDGVFEGTVKANNLYHGVCFLSAVGGFLNHRWYCKPQDAYGNDSWPYIKESLEYTFDFNVREYYTTEEILQISDNVIQSPAQSGFERCSGYSDIVYVLPAVNNTYPEVWLPHPADVEGKVVDVYGFYYGSPSTIPSFDVRCVFKNSQQETRMALLLEYNTDASPKLIVSSPSPYLPVTAGQLTRFVSVRAVVNNVEGCYWLKINLSEGSGGSGVTETRVLELIQSNAATQQWVTDHFLTSFTETDPTVPSWAKQSSKPSYQFSEITNKPTTIAGYGITDTYISNGTIYLGGNTITPLTQHQSLAGYATQSWVDSQSFVTESAFSGMLENEAYISNGTIYIGGNSITPITDGDLGDYVSVDAGGMYSHPMKTQSKVELHKSIYGNGCIEFYGGTTEALKGSLDVDNNGNLRWTANSATKRVLLAGDANNIPLHDSNGNWSGGITSMSGLVGYFHYVSAGVYELDYLPNGDVGVQNGKVLRLEELPGYDVIKANSNYNQDYNRIDGNIDPDDYSDEAYFKGLVRWAITEYLGVYKSDSSNITLIGSARPNSTGTVHIDLYGGSGRNPNADDPTLPMYCSGMYLTLSGTIFIFGTIEGAWYWRQINSASIDAASLGGVAAANYATQSWVQNNYLPTNGGTVNNLTVSYILYTKGLAITDEIGNILFESYYTDAQHSGRYVKIWGDNGNDATEPPEYYEFDSEVRATAFKKIGSSNDYVLLGGGGTKEVIDFATWMDRPVTARGLNVAGDSTLAAPHVRMTYDYVSAGRFSMNFNGYAGDSMAAPISYIFDAPVTQSSDIRMKDVTDYLEPSVYDMASAPLVRFRWKNDAAGTEHVGTVAQFWQQVVPEAVVETADGMLTMDYATAGVVAGVTAARKAVELERRIEEQDRRIEELEQIINQLKGN